MDLEAMLLQAEENELALEEEIWQPIPTSAFYPDYVSDFPAIEIVNRNIGSVDNEVSVIGEANSQYIEFIMNRFIDGVDLVSKLINIHYQLDEETGSNDGITNGFYSDTKVKFGWVIPPNALIRESFQFCIFAVGEEYSKDYVYSTKPKTVKVEKGLILSSGIIEPDTDWYIQFVNILTNRVNELISEAQVEMSEMAKTYAGDAEAWADGTRDGQPIGPDDPAYQNNAKYYVQKIIEEGLVNVRGNWNQTDPTAQDYIFNKPDFEGLSDEVTSINTSLIEQADAGYLLRNLLSAKFIKYSGYIKTDENELMFFKAGTYTISGLPTSTSTNLYVMKYVNGVYNSNVVAKNIGAVSSYTFEIPSDMYIAIQINNSSVNVTDNIMVEKGNTAHSYVPYCPPNTMISALNSNLTDIKMLGWEVPEECPIKNGVSGNQFIQRVGRVDIGDLAVERQSNSGNYYFHCTFDVACVTATNDAYLQGYTATNSHGWSNLPNLYYRTGEYFVRIRNDSYTDANSFKNAMKGHYFYYPLATPITKTIDGNEAVSALNESLSDQGLVNEFSNSYQQGYYNERVIIANNDNVADTKRYDCNGGDLISIKYHGHLGVGIRVCYYDASDVYLTVKEGTDTYIENAPSNAKYFRYFLANGSNFPIGTAVKTSVYVNNAIDISKPQIKEFSVEAQANTVAEIDYNSRNAIPTIISISNSLQHQTTIFFNNFSGKWNLYSSVGQTYTIRFFEFN